MGEWEKVAALSQEIWRTAQENVRFAMAPLAAEAAWNLGRYGVPEQIPFSWNSGTDIGAGGRRCRTS
jgi:hypothetical protein